MRGAARAVRLGISAALALGAFEFGKDIAGLDRHDKEERVRLHAEVPQQLRAHHAQARQIADTADSLHKTERAALEHLALKLRQLEADKQTLQADLGFFQSLLPSPVRCFNCAACKPRRKDGCERGGRR